ncbi:ribosome 60S biogenesis N-terminal-domain-containing protein [Mycena crocata]|nr:ribosome 60S biogenesis N-terminal-domain-containing protein [Mycena crocata]
MASTSTDASSTRRHRTQGSMASSSHSHGSEETRDTHESTSLDTSGFEIVSPRMGGTLSFPYHDLDHDQPVNGVRIFSKFTNDPEHLPADLAHHFLLAICTRPGIGICFKDQGWYPRKSETDNVPDEELRSRDKSGKIYNKILANILKTLKVNENLRQQELALKIMAACAELVASRSYVGASTLLQMDREYIIFSIRSFPSSPDAIVTLADLQHKETLKSRKRQLAAVLGLPLRFLSADVPPRRRRGARGKKAPAPAGEQPTFTNPTDEWICAFCEYHLFYGDDAQHRHAVRSRKKILRRRRTREHAAAAASGTSTAKAPPEKAQDVT